MVGGADPQSYQVQANFAELESVKAEIQARSDRQATMLTTCITAIGAIAGLYFTKVTAEIKGLLHYSLGFFCAWDELARSRRQH